MTGAVVWLCATIAIAASLSLWWLLTVAGALLIWLHFQRQHAAPAHHRLSIATIVSLVSYALLLSIALLTVRAALGLLELPVVPIEPAGLAPGMRSASVGYYDKSELQLALLELAALTVVFSILFVRLAEHWIRQKGERLVVYPLSAAFGFVLYFASVQLPPYAIDLDYWHPLIAAATGIHAEDWRPFIADAGLGLWLWSFGLSTLSLSAAATLCNLAAGIASFALLRRLSGSRAVALLGASYLLLEATTAHAGRLSFPAPAHVALAMLLLYLSLRSRGERTWPAFLFGLSVAWDPLFGACAAIGFLLAHGAQMRGAPVRTLFALCGGIAASVIAALAVHGVLMTLPADRVPVAPGILEPPLPFLSLLASVLLVLPFTLRKSGRFRQWTPRRLFAVAGLLCGVLYALLAAALADPYYSYPIQWVLVPVAALAFYSAVRAIFLRGRFRAPRRFRAALSLGASTLMLVLCIDLFFPIDRLNLALARYATGYESERAAWYRQCAEGRACDPGAKPTLAHHIRHASRPLALERETTRGI